MNLKRILFIDHTSIPFYLLSDNSGYANFVVMTTTDDIDKIKDHISTEIHFDAIIFRNCPDYYRKIKPVYNGICMSASNDRFMRSEDSVLGLILLPIYPTGFKTSLQDMFTKH